MVHVGSMQYNGLERDYTSKHINRSLVNNIEDCTDYVDIVMVAVDFDIFR